MIRSGSANSWASSWANSRTNSRAEARKCIFGACALVLACLAPVPAAATDWLVLLVDRSNSIDPEELRLQRQAYIRLLTDEAVGRALNDTQVAIVEFDSRTELVTGWTSAQGAAQCYSRRSPDGLRGQTGIGHAVELALTLLAGKQGRRAGHRDQRPGDRQRSRGRRLRLRPAARRDRLPAAGGAARGLPRGAAQQAVPRDGRPQGTAGLLGRRGGGRGRAVTAAATIGP